MSIIRVILTLSSPFGELMEVQTHPEIGQAAKSSAFTTVPEPETPTPLSPRSPWINQMLAFAALLLFSYFGIALSRQSQGVATIWFTNGMLFAIIITNPRKIWWQYFLIGFLADTIADRIWGDPLRLSAGVAAANSIEVILSVLILTRWFG